MAKIIARSGLVRISLVLILILGLAGAGAYFFLGGPRQSLTATASAGGASEEKAEPEQQDITVKSVKPHQDDNFSMTMSRPADVLDYYRDDLGSRVPGVISMIRTDSGDVVKEGETLIEVDVPELRARVEQQTAALSLANAQVKQKDAAIVSAKAQLDVIQAKIKAAEARTKSDKAYLVFRQRQQKRFQDLLALKSIDNRLVDEQEDRLEAALQALNASIEAKHSAEAEKVAIKAKVVQAEADLEEAKQKVKVTQAELDHAKVLLAFATIKAPFDGVIVDRDNHTNVGTIVQKAETGNPMPLLTIQRSDIVRVVVRVPDIYSTYVTPGTEAIFETPSLPGVKIHGRVTRFPPSLVNHQHDRTMPVEVDLWNGSKEDYVAKMADEKFKSRLRKGMPNDPNKGLPILPEIKGKLASGRVMRLLPGTFGTMTLVLRKFDKAYLLPSQSIVSQGGRPYIYVVQSGKAHLQPVDVQVDDGKLVKVELVGKNGGIEGDLKGDEEVIISNQGELSEGQPVKATRIDDWRTLNSKPEKKER